MHQAELTCILSTSTNNATRTLSSRKQAISYGFLVPSAITKRETTNNNSEPEQKGDEYCCVVLLIGIYVPYYALLIRLRHGTTNHLREKYQPLRKESDCFSMSMENRRLPSAEVKLGASFRRRHRDTIPELLFARQRLGVRPSHNPVLSGVRPSLLSSRAAW